MTELKQTTKQIIAKILIITSLIFYVLTAVLPYVYDPFLQFLDWYIFIFFSPLSIALFFGSILMTLIALITFKQQILFRGTAIISFLLIIYQAFVLPMIRVTIPELQMHLGYFTYVIAGSMSLIAGIINEFPEEQRRQKELNIEKKIEEEMV